MNKGDLVKTEMIKAEDYSELAGLYPGRKIFSHERLPFISYPYEWPFSMFKDAGLFTLKLQRKLIAHNLSLKDATPFNVQFTGSRLVFIDYGSFEPISQNGVWFAYNQFMQMFFYPLALRIFAGVDFKSLLLTHLEGISFADTYGFIGWRTKLKIGYISYFLLPKLFSVGSNRGKLKDTQALKRNITPQNNRAVQTFMINRLLKATEGLDFKLGKSVWSDYIETKSYSTEAEAFKQNFIADFLHERKVSTVIDLGANTGEYSLIAEKAGCSVVAVEFDHNSIERLYTTARDQKLRILPLWVDIANPTPAIGWHNQERKSFLDRFKSDCVFALALIHHLLVSNRQPLSRIVDLLAGMTTKYLIVEYIGKNDPMFQLLTLNRKESYEYYNEEFFQKEFTRRFRVLKSQKITNMEREIFVMEKVC
jgi:hypothetical protein